MIRGVNAVFGDFKTWLIKGLTFKIDIFHHKVAQNQSLNIQFFRDKKVLFPQRLASTLPPLVMKFLL